MNYAIQRLEEEARVLADARRQVSAMNMDSAERAAWLAEIDRGIRECRDAAQHLRQIARSPAVVRAEPLSAH